MISPTVEPCTSWVPIGCQSIDPSGAAISGTMLAVAQEILYRKSGSQFDQCTLTLRPCRRSCYDGMWPWADQWNEWGTGWPYPYLFAGQWFNLGCASCGDTCSCSVIHDILLPYPVAEVLDVTIDGTSLTPLSDHVLLYDHRRLIRIDGEMWPICNDLSKPAGDVDTWTIQVSIGTPVPQLGRVALGELTNELVKACIGADCKFPQNVQQIVRQGVTQNRLDPSQVFAAGKIGLYFSDLFIDTYNPGHIQDRARVIAVDGHRSYPQQTWP